MVVYHEMTRFDGTRCMTYIDKKNQTFRFLNRRFRFFEGNYPEFKKAIFDCVKAEKIILDAELVIFEKGKASFSLLAEREARLGAAARPL